VLIRGLLSSPASHNHLSSSHPGAAAARQLLILLTCMVTASCGPGVRIVLGLTRPASAFVRAFTGLHSLRVESWGCAALSVDDGRVWHSSGTTARLALSGTSQSVQWAWR